MTTRLFVSEALFNGAQIELEDDQARYLGRVMRARVGDSVCLFNGDGHEWRADITAISKRSVTLLVGDGSQPATESPLTIHLLQGVARGDRMDFVVQKVTELGVRRITPVLTDHSVVKLDSERGARRQLHWQGVANSACEQCGRVVPPQIDAPVRLNDWFGDNQNSEATQLVMSPTAGCSIAALPELRQPVQILVGPEGGLSDSELADAEVAGFSPVCMGPRVLRTESAAMVALALLQARAGDLA